MNDSRLPLSGVRIIDFSRLLPGPWATQMLGEFGADVIKIEQPKTGDPSRHSQPRYETQSVYFNSVNASKRSITLDLGLPAGQAVAHRLLASADVVIESFRNGVAAKLHIDAATARGINPRLIYCSITGFGREGPLAHVAGHDLLIQALAGSIGRSVQDGNPAVTPPFQAADLAGSLMACVGILTALAQRAKTGQGCDIDVPMFDALLYMSPVPLSSAISRAAGGSGEPRHEGFGANPRYRFYLSADHQPVAVSLLEASSWERFCKHIGRADLIPQGEGAGDRLSAHGERGAIYERALTEYCQTHTAAQITDMMIATGIAMCAAASPDEALASAQAKERGLLKFLQHPTEGRVPYLVNPLARANLCREEPLPSPGLGQHSDDILVELGFSNAEIAALREQAVV